MLTVSSALFAGIDAGGSHCRVRLEDETGTLLGEGRSGAANLALGWPQVEANVWQALNAALQQAGLDSSAVGRLHVGAGFAGAHLAGLKASALHWPHPFASWHVSTDLHVACYGAHQGQPGGVIILGTGFSAIVLSEQQERLIGGYGFPVNAVCSGSGLGLQAVQAVLLTTDNLAPDTVLVPMLEQHFAAKGYALAEKLLDATPQAYAELAPLVFNAARAKDEVAQKLLADGVDFISRLISQIKLSGVQRLCLVGGVGQQFVPLLPANCQHALTPALGDAMQGAIYLARQHWAQSQAATQHA